MIETLLLLTNIILLVVLIVIALYLRRLADELPNFRSQVVIVQQPQEVVAILAATVLAGGALRFEDEELGNQVVDFDGRGGPFSKIPGEELTVTFQKRRRL